MVGSGPGGGVLAWTLAQQGHRVTVVEAGPRVRVSQMGQSMGKILASYMWDGGTRTVRGNVVFPTMQVRALGGGTVFNAAICMRILPSALATWRDDHGLTDLTDEALAAHYDAVEAYLGIRPVDDAVMGRKNALFRDACQNLGWSWEPTKRFEEGCEGSGECLTGCRTGAKQSLDRRGLDQVIAAGGRVMSSVHVDRLLIEHGRVRGIVGTTVDPDTHERGHPVRIHAGCTIVCAGAIGSPTILRRSGLTRDAIGSALRFHPSCYQLGVFDEVVNPWSGATQGMQSNQHLEQGIKLEALWCSSSTFSRSLPRRPKAFKRYLKQWPNIAVWDGWVSGNASVGEVRLLPGGRPDLRYRFSTSDARRLQEANALLCEMYAAVGAREVFTGLPGMPEGIDPAEAASRIRETRYDATELPTASNHVFGGSPMGADPARAVCDSWGQVYDADDLYICDTGLYPTSPGVNPQLTAMALGHRLGTALPDRY